MTCGDCELSARNGNDLAEEVVQLRERVRVLEGGLQTIGQMCAFAPGAENILQLAKVTLDDKLSPIRTTSGIQGTTMADLTREERLAVDAFVRLGRRWPKTLRVIHGGSEGSALLVKRACEGVDPFDLKTIVHVKGFNADSTS